MVGRFLTDLSPVRTHGHRTVGMDIGMSVTFLMPHASVVAFLPPSVTMTVTISGSYLGTSVPPCLRIWDEIMSDRDNVRRTEYSHIFHLLFRRVSGIPHIYTNIENRPPAQVLADIRGFSVRIVIFLDQHFGVLHGSHLRGLFFSLLYRYYRVFPLLDLTKGRLATKWHCRRGTFRGARLRG